MNVVPAVPALQEDMRVFNIFLFKLTLPASVILGLGIKTNLYSQHPHRSLHLIETEAKRPHCISFLAYWHAAGLCCLPSSSGWCTLPTT